MKDEEMLQMNMRSTLASLEMEGFYLSPEQKALCDEVVLGKMDMAELIEIMLKRCS